ncbi:MAG TPA: dihydropteroate synthase [Nocardioides sp.]|nr:dihydropteroate synthase [Nocardioides sp.]
MISLSDLAALHSEYADDLARPVEPVTVGGVTIGGPDPVLMGTVNLSRDSTYRESVAVSTEAAVRKARTQLAQGAQVVDLGAESSTAAAARVDADGQLARLLPVVEALAPDAVVSVETYRPEVVEACLAAGARVLNLTGREGEDEMLACAASYDATVVLCFCEPDDVRAGADHPTATDALPYLVDHFGPRLEHARTLGVRQVVVDPGLGFYYANLVDPAVRVRHQAAVLAQCFRLRTLGVPVCNALPHAFDLFEDQFRTAEGFFAVLARLGGTDLFRTHEVAHVRAVLAAMDALDVEQPPARQPR